MNSQSYKDLIVWQKAMTLASEIYKLLKRMPSEELYALSKQMRRAAVAIPSNIAEGQSTDSTEEFIHYLSIVRGARAELETQLYICEKLGYMTVEQIQPCLELLDEIGRITAVMIKSSDIDK